MKLLRVLKRFNDVLAGFKRDVGQTFEATEDRAIELLRNPYNIVEEIKAGLVESTKVEDLSAPLKAPETPENFNDSEKTLEKKEKKTRKTKKSL